MKTFYQLSDDFIAYRWGLNFSEQTLTKDSNHLKQFLQWLETQYAITTADRLRLSQLTAWQSVISNQTNSKGLPIKPGSVNNKISAVRNFLGYLYTHGFLSTDLARKLRSVKAPRLLPTSVLSHSQVKKLLRKIDTTTATGHMHRSLLEVLYSSGIRIGELLGLLIDSVDLDNGTMRVLGKGSKERIVPLGKTALRYLESYLRAIRPFLPGNRTSKALFLTSAGRPYTRVAFCHMLRKYVTAAGIEDKKVTAHTFRRSCTTELVRANANLWHVKELLGHSDLQTLQHYAKLDITDLKKTHAKYHPRERD